MALAKAVRSLGITRSAEASWGPGLLRQRGLVDNTRFIRETPSWISGMSRWL